MKKLIAVVLALVLVFTLTSVALADPDTKGNGLPKGKCYNLNIIGLPKGEGYSKELNENFDGGNGNRIFVGRGGTTTFYIHGIDAPYQVLDHNGTDGEVGSGFGEGPPPEWGIQFPYIGGHYEAEIYVRLVGPMDSSVDWTAYGEGEALPFGSFTLNRLGDKKFQLKTGQLLDDRYENILWYLDNKTKFRICQLRIYVPEGY